MNQARYPQDSVNDNAARIRAFRLALGLSQGEVARELGWTQPRIASYEGRHFVFSAKMEARIMAAIQAAADRKAVR